MRPGVYSNLHASFHVNQINFFLLYFLSPWFILLTFEICHDFVHYVEVTYLKYIICCSINILPSPPRHFLVLLPLHTPGSSLCTLS